MTCTRCKQDKLDDVFTWHDAAHTKRDLWCRACRASVKRSRYKPRNAVKPATYRYGLGPDVADHLTDTQLAYIAGIVDGEGCVSSTYPKSAARPLFLALTMIHRPTILWLKTVVGGGVVRHQTRQGGVRQAWTWLLSGIRAYALLRRLVPFMHTKREEAKVACRIGETFFVNQVRGRVTPEVHALRNEAGQQLRDLKRREWKAE